MQQQQEHQRRGQNRQAGFDWALGLNRMGAELLGVWPSEEHCGSSERSSPEPWHVKMRVPVIIITMTLAVLLPQFYAISKVIHELPLIIDNLMTNCACCTGCVKYLFLWRNKRVLWPVIEGATSDWLESPRKSQSERRAMLKHATRARHFTVVGYFVLLGCYAGFTVAPLLGLDIRMINNITDYAAATKGRKLVVQSYFPFDYSRTPYFQLLHACQLFAGFFMAMSISMPDNYFGALVFHLSAQFEILAEQIDLYFPSAASNSSGRDAKLKALVDRHVYLLSMVTAVESSFCYVMLAQVFNTSLMLCCVGFQILGLIGNNGGDAGAEPSYFQLITLLGVICALMMHTLVDCYASETLAHQSTKLFHSVYECHWYAIAQLPDVLPSTARNLVPVMMVSRIARQLTGGKIFCLSLATYCNILKSSAGYISMLIAVSRR